MSRKQELDKDIEVFWLIYTQSRQSLEVYKYLKSTSASGQFWEHIAFTSLKDCFIELDKLLSTKDSQHYRLDGLINKLKPGGQYSSFKFSEAQLNDWSKIFLIFHKTLNKISVLRNKKYAHTDRNFKVLDQDFDIDIMEIEKIFDFLENVIQVVHQHCLDSTASTKLLFYAKDLRIFDDLEELRKIRTTQFIEGLNRNK